MEKRIIGKAGKESTILGMGAMRLPMQDINGKKIIKEEESIKTILRAFELGINIIDTAYHYGYKQNELVVGKALGIWRKNNKKSRIYLSTKFPTLLAKKRSDYRTILEEQLKKLDVDNIDFYHFHGLNDEYFNEKVLKFDLIAEALKAKEEGLITHICFSFHDTADVMKKIIDTNIFDAVLCQYNILDTSLEEAISYATKRGLGVFIMGPVGGGRIKELGYLKEFFGEDMFKIYEIALKFVFSNRNVATAFSGMENTQMLEENVKIAENFSGFTTEEKNLLEKFINQKDIAELIPCTNCQYCLPCPNNVAIPKILRILNYNKLTGLEANASWQYKNIPINDIYDSMDYFRFLYNNRAVKHDNLKLEGVNRMADACTECGNCMEKCPQGIDIIKNIKDAHEIFAS